MTGRRLALLVALGLMSTLGGCVSPAERKTNDEALCRSYGFRPGTDGFASCLQNIDLDRSATRRQLLDRPYGYGLGVGYGFGRRGWW